MLLLRGPTETKLRRRSRPRTKLLLSGRVSTMRTFIFLTNRAVVYLEIVKVKLDVKAIHPVELLDILPTCSFRNFCFKKYLLIVHPKMEDSLFGDLEQRRQVLDGHHPRSPFYGEFLGLDKVVWLLHLLAFALDPPVSHFEASSWAEFHSYYMESVVRDCGGNRGPKPMTVGFPVSPGLKLGNGSIIKARVYMVSKDG